MVKLVQKLDERGLTSKAERAVIQHSKISNIRELLSSILEELQFELTFNSPGIISSEYLSELEVFLKELYEMWEEIDYPFKEELLVRTAKFDNLNLSMPVTTIPILNGSEISEVKKFIKSAGDIDQILVHPQISADVLSTQGIMVRSLVGYDSVEVDLGYKGTQHIRKLEQADNVVTISIKDGQCNIEYKKGDKDTLDVDFLRKIGLFLDVSTPLIEKEFLDEDKLQKNSVVEFKIVPKEDLWYFIVSSFEVI